MSGFCTSRTSAPPPSSAFLILLALVEAGRKSAGAAAITTASASAAAATTASRSSAVVSTRTTFTPAGSARSTLAATRVTWAPRAAAVRASATPWRPEERLPRKRTGSRYSRVPPAETTTWRPRRSSLGRRRGPRTSSAAAKISAGLGQPALAGVGAGQPALGGLEHDDAARAQGGDVGLGGGVLPHLGVHGRSHHHRAARRQQGVGEQVVGQAVGGLGQHVRGGRRDHDEVGLLPDPDVRHLVDVGPDVVADRLAGQRRPGGGAHEPQRGRGGHDRDVVPGLGEAPQQLAGLVGRDAAADAQHHARCGRRTGHEGDLRARGRPRWWSWPGRCPRR